MRKYYIAFSTVALLLICIIFNVVISKRYFSEQVGIPGSDPVKYNTMALAILNGNNYFMIGDTKVDIGREVTPFYSALVAAAYLAGGINIKSPIILNIIFNCLTIIFLFFTIRLITKNIFISFLLSFVLIFYYPLWRMNFLIMMEVTSVFFLSLTLFLFSKFYYEKKAKYIYFATGMFTLLCLINNRFIVLLFVFFVFLFFFACVKKYNFQKGLLIPSIIALIAFSPWFIRQFNVYDQFVFFTPLWNNVICDNIGILKRVNIPTGADDIAADKPLAYEEYIKGLREYNKVDIQNSRIQAFTFSKYNEVVKKHNFKGNRYMIVLKKYFTLFYRDFQFMSPDDFRLVPPSTMPFKMAQIFILLPMFLLSLIGFLFSLFKRELLIFFFSLLFFSHLFLHILIGYTDRYRLTILPVLLIIASYGLLEILKILKRSSIVNKFCERICPPFIKKSLPI